MNLKGMFTAGLMMIMSLSLFMVATPSASREALPLPAEAAAVEAVPTQTAEGLVLEADETGFLLKTTELGEVRMRVDGDTTLEGVEAIAAGQYLYVEHDGRMTRSLPPQVYARAVKAFVLTGEVVRVSDGRAAVREDDGAETVVNLPEGVPAPEVGQRVTVYFNGLVMSSMPPQITAAHIVAE